MLATTPNQVGQQGHVEYIVSFVCSTKMSKHCKNKQFLFVHSKHEWAIPKDNRKVHQIWSDKTTVKLLQSAKLCVNVVF